jgi:ureidoglycolate lyase
MKLLRWGPKGSEKPGVLGSDGKPRDLSGVLGDIDAALLGSDFAALKDVDIDALPPVPAGARQAEPVAGVGKFVCIGLNYRDHAEESGMAIPSEPIVFMKATSAIIGPNDDVYLPPNA